MEKRVYFFPCSVETPLPDRQKAVVELFSRVRTNLSFPAEGLIAIKTHFGEGACAGYIKPENIKPVVQYLTDNGYSPFLTDTNTLYVGNRSNSVDHLKMAAEHGFTHEKMGCPVLISDGLRGTHSANYPINGEHFTEVPLAGDIVHSDGMVLFSHLTGHMLAGFGAAIKNLAMGCVPRKGKLMQHSSMNPWVEQDGCVACGNCAKWCPADAIEVYKTAYIDDKKCIGCGECLTVCPTNTIKFSWKQDIKVFQEMMAEFAYGVTRALENKIVYINVLMHVTKECDCVNKSQEPVAPDIGILASDDPVAIDMASLDLFRKSAGSAISDLSYPEIPGTHQIFHAEKLGAGSTNYEIVEVKL